MASLVHIVVLVLQWSDGLVEQANPSFTFLPETLLSLNDFFFLIPRTKLGGNRTTGYLCSFVLDVCVQKEAGNTGL